jgi:hypothetical protein
MASCTAALRNVAETMTAQLLCDRGGIGLKQSIGNRQYVMFFCSF